jgi:hypothetical protein
LRRLDRALAVAITVGILLVEPEHPSQAVNVGTTEPSTRSPLAGARAESIRLLDAAVLPPNTERAKKAPVSLVTTGIHGACNKQVDLARFWVVKRASPRRVATFLEHHVPTGMTDGGSGLGTGPEPDTYTFFVFPEGQLASLNELYFTVTALRQNSTAVRADGIGIPHDASCYIN